MGWIIVTRNPRTRKLIVVTEDDCETVAEFATEAAASDAAIGVPVCRAWNYEAIEVPS